MRSQTTGRTEYHVSPTGSDSANGDARSPLRTISAAARLAQPGDVVTVHAGVYRERVTPLRGGDADERRIVYRAAEGEVVEIRGSEVVKHWDHAGGVLWKASIPSRLFGDYNPYADRIRGDWFGDQGRTHHTGRVYVDGVPIPEVASLEHASSSEGDDSAWFADVNEETTTIWARLPGADPNRQLVEINFRPTIFYPQRPGVNYITVRGFIMRHAATQWAPPTTEQIGLLGTHWSRGWIIENNIISDSRCTGITLGKYGAGVDDTGATADRYNETVRDALGHGWNRETIGGHIVRDNVIHGCEQAGICGSLGGAFSEITGNHIHHIHVERQFTGAEMAGIKLHGAVDTLIRNNCIHHSVLGIWLDWMAQGTRCSGNLMYENGSDVFVEVNHGPFVFDNNLLLSETSLSTMSQGGAYVHNLVAGSVVQRPELSRMTPYHRAHSTEIAGLGNVRGGDDRYYHNVFARHGGLSTYDEPSEAERLPAAMHGNVFLDNASPSEREGSPVRVAQPSDMELSEREGAMYLRIRVDDSWTAGGPRKPVTTELLGKARIPDVRFTNRDGSPMSIDRDYFGNEREPGSPAPGPFARPERGWVERKVWPR